MKQLNTTFLRGRISREFELLDSSEEGKGKAFISLAVPHSWKKDEQGNPAVSFIDIVVYNKLAIYLYKEAHVGDELEIQNAELVSYTKETEQGNRKSILLEVGNNSTVSINFEDRKVREIKKQENN